MHHPATKAKLLAWPLDPFDFLVHRVLIKAIKEHI